MAKLRKFECCICGDTIKDDYGNNPDPFVGDRCCNFCNETCVIPARLQMALLIEQVSAGTAEARAKARADNARARVEPIKQLGPWTPGVIQGGVQ
jgi:hypothetical protein